MIDKNLLRLLGSNKKYIFYAVGLMVLGLFANVGITASICWAINLAIHYDEYSGGAIIFLWPAVCAVIGIAIRYTASRLVGDLKDLLGRKAKKDLREKVYNKIGHGRKFCVSDFRQTQEYHSYNVHNRANTPCPPLSPSGWNGMRAGTA